MKKIKRLVNQFLGLFPSALPTGVSEFQAWAKDIADTYDLPTKDTDSVNFTLTTIIMHLGPQVAKKPKYHFVLTLRAAAAKQVAGQVFTDIKEAQKRKALEAQSDGQKQ